MASRADMAISMKEFDARVLEDAARIARRRGLRADRSSIAALCRALTDAASELRAEAREIRDQTSGE